MAMTGEIAEIIEQLYAMDRILAAMQKKPHDYGGVSLHTNEAHTLKLIALNEGISQMELTEQTYRTKGATSVMVDKLVEKGLVNRRRVNGDQRRYLLTLTQRGREVNDAHLAYDSLHAQWVSREIGLEEGDLKTTRQTLGRIIEFYSQHYLEHGTAITPQIQ